MALLRALYLLVSILLFDAAASPLHIRTVLHERREYTPRGWNKGERLPGTAILPMRIGLTQNNLDEGHDVLMDL